MINPMIEGATITEPQNKSLLRFLDKPNNFNAIPPTQMKRGYTQPQFLILYQVFYSSQ